MKTDIHPEYHDVVFMDAGVTPPFQVLTRSTRTSEETIEWEDGKTYPVIRVEISSATHPFYTGKMKLIDSAGMVDRFRRRYGITSDDADEATQDADGDNTSEDSVAAEAPTPAEQADSAAQPEAEATQADS